MQFDDDEFCDYQSVSPSPTAASPQRAEYPALAALGLSDADFAELARQGFVSPEQRGTRRYFKLRFRRDGRQVVRYIGRSQQKSLVEQELTRLQARLHTRSACRRELNQITRLARQALRKSKQRLAPVLAAHGLAFHGLAVRRPRKPATNDRVADIPTSRK